jgi:MoaA/NifB/PqqE/SkfB family radical SAM enzyme
VQVKNLLQAIPRVLFSNSPLDAQLIVTRRCNLSCGYCSEYDSTSDPVPTEELKSRIDALHGLKTINITMLGGEPLMHPDIAELVEYAGRKSSTSLVTNGFLLRNSAIESLNEAGLNNLTVSIDTLNADPSRYIQKSLRSLRTRLERLARLARFDVHVTAVLCESSRDEFRDLIKEVQSFGFNMSLNLIHNAKGHITIGGQEYIELYEYFYKDGKPFTYLDYEYGKKLLQGDRPDWKCRAGARYLYVDEHGDVQLCASQLGRLGKPLKEYTKNDLNEQANDKLGFAKAIAKGYIRGSMFDNGRRRAPLPAPIDQ